MLLKAVTVKHRLQIAESSRNECKLHSKYEKIITRPSILGPQNPITLGTDEVIGQMERFGQ